MFVYDLTLYRIRSIWSGTFCPSFSIFTTMVSSWRTTLELWVTWVSLPMTTSTFFPMRFQKTKLTKRWMMKEKTSSSQKHARDHSPALAEPLCLVCQQIPLRPTYLQKTIVHGICLWMNRCQKLQRKILSSVSASSMCLPPRGIDIILLSM